MPFLSGDGFFLLGVPFGSGYHAAHRANASFFRMGLCRSVSIPDAGFLILFVDFCKHRLLGPSGICFHFDFSNSFFCRFRIEE